MASWKLTIDLAPFWANDSLSFAQKRDKIVKTIRKSGWLEITEEEWVLKGLLEELADCSGVPDFDFIFGAIYDQADLDRVWIEIG